MAVPGFHAGSAHSHLCSALGSLRGLCSPALLPAENAARSAGQLPTEAAWLPPCLYSRTLLAMGTEGWGSLLTEQQQEVAETRARGTWHMARTVA